MHPVALWIMIMCNLYIGNNFSEEHPASIFRMLFYSEGESSYLSPKHSYPPTRLHSAITHNIILPNIISAYGLKR
jgi:hypothetical protein